MTYSSGGNDTETDFVPVGKEKRKYLRNVKVIPGELEHRLTVVDVEERILKKSGKKSKRVKWRVWKLKKKEIKEEFEQRVVQWCRSWGDASPPTFRLHPPQHLASAVGAILFRNRFNFRKR